MSRWLKGLDQVSNLIGKLDDRAATVAEEVSGKDDIDDVAGIGEIVSKRGLEDHVSDEEDGMDFDGAPDRDTSLAHHETMSDQVVGDGLESMNQEGIKPKKQGSDDDDSTGNYNDRAEQVASTVSVSVKGGETMNLPQITEKSLHSNHVSQFELTTAAPEQKESERKQTMELVGSSKETQKEVRTLRKHVVRLNTTLEHAENEIAALRDELRQAAKRMDKDKANAKEQKEAFQKQKSEDMKAIREENERALTEQRAVYEEQVTILKQTISELEETRRQEGGNWNKEITQALEREQEMGTRVGVLEDEKLILLSQISTMQNQQAALASRVDSLSQASDAAETRERDTEERLDLLLSQHARQISQRQSREVELERMIQELNLALVASAAAKNSEEEPRPEAALTRAHVDALEMELQSVQVQLGNEQKRVEILHQQLKEMSKENSQEASAVHVLQVQYQQQVEDLVLELSRVQAIRRDGPGQVSFVDQESDPPHNNNTLSHQVKLLSQEVLKLREKLAHSSGELKALKSRFKEANNRATKAEDELAVVTLDGIERAASSSFGGFPARKPTEGGSSSTIRSLMRLTPGRGDRTEQIGKVVDVVDKFAVATGKYLRRKPLARAGFIFYLLMVHMWTFLLLFFHAHNFETSRTEFGSIVAVGPDSLLEQHKDIAQEVVEAIRSSSHQGI